MSLELILAVLSPMLCAFCSVLFKNNKLKYALLFCGLACFVTFSGVVLYNFSIDEHPLSYVFGGFEAPYAIEYSFGFFARSLLIVCMILSVFWTIFALITHYKNLSKSLIFLLLSVGGVSGVCFSGDLFNIYIFFEIFSISSYIFVALSPHSEPKKPFNEAFEYLKIGILSSSLLLIGIGILYKISGSLNVRFIGEFLAINEVNPNLLFASCAFLLSGLALKSGVIPFCAWSIRLYSNLEPQVLAFTAGLNAKVSLYLILMFVYKIFYPFLIIANLDSYFIYITAFGTAAIGLYSVSQVNIQRILAISSATNLSYIFIAILTLNEYGLIALMSLVLLHAIVKFGLFVCLYIFFHKSKVDYADLKYTDLRGKIKQYPFVSVIFITLLGVLVGVPPFLGFFVKLHLGTALIHSEHFIPLGLLVISFTTSFIYTSKLISSLR
jgi:formate hydrogenlyase subunit 3/multisubunit Na+/H+ antiporter MnhD subunit